MDTFTITLLGACGTALVGAIGILWKDNIQWRNDYNNMREKMQDKNDENNKVIIDAVNSNVSVINSLVGALASLKEAITSQGKQWDDFQRTSRKRK